MYYIPLTIKKIKTYIQTYIPVLSLHFLTHTPYGHRSACIIFFSFIHRNREFVRLKSSIGIWQNYKFDVIYHFTCNIMFHVVITCFFIHTWNKKVLFRWRCSRYVLTLCTSLYFMLIAMWLPRLRYTIMPQDTPLSSIITPMIPHRLYSHLITRGHWIWLMLVGLCPRLVVPAWPVTTLSHTRKQSWCTITLRSTSTNLSMGCIIRVVYGSISLGLHFGSFKMSLCEYPLDQART